MRRLLPASVALGSLVVVFALLYAARLVRSFETPEFEAHVAREATAVVGARVRFDSIDVSLLRGIRLGGVRVQNPAGFRGDLLSVEEARLSYDLWPLLRGRIQVDELSLGRPVITLATDARGAFNYRKLSPLAPAPPTGSSTAVSSLLRLGVSKLSVEEGRFAIMDEKNVPALRLEGASLQSALALESGVATGTGKARIDSVILANALYLKGVRAPLKLTKAGLNLAPLQASLAGGSITGGITVAFKPDMRYTLQVVVRGAKVATLLKEAGSAATLTGNLDAKAGIEGTGGVLTVMGFGQAEIKDCRWPKAPLLGVLADLLRVPELRDPRFDECRIEFTLASGQARTPVVSFKGPAVELTGHGVTSLVTSAIEYDLTLGLAPGLLARVPAQMKAGFKTRSDGFGAIPFKVTGTTAAPRTDLLKHVGKAAAVEAAKEGLGRLFGPKRKQ